MTSGDENDGPRGGDQLRLDKWLWFARVVKSRTLAAGLVTSGKVRINRDRTIKPSQSLRIGDILTISVGTRIRVLEVVAMGTRRGPASEAQALYIDRSPPPVPTEAAAMEPARVERTAGAGRPTKRERRQIDRLTDTND